MERREFRGAYAQPSSPGHAHDRFVEADRTGGAEEAGVAESEDAAAGGHEPVALAGRGGGHAHDRLVEMEGPGGAEEAGTSVVEDPAVRRDQPVALAGRGGGNAHDRVVRGCRTRRSRQPGGYEIGRAP